MPLRSPVALIIDDEEDICFLLGIVLKQKHYEVVNSNSLKEGRKKLEELKPEVLFLDISLPDGSGLSEIKTFRKQFPEMKIVMMSAHDGTAEKKAAMQDGADYFLGKPLSQEVIENSIEQLFEKK